MSGAIGMKQDQGVKRAIGFDGLRPLERRVLGLWDAGRSIEQIVEETGVPRGRISTILATLAQPDDHDAMIRRGSIQLAAVINAYFARRASA